MPLVPRQTDMLLLEAGRGNRAAFESLYDQVAGMVYGVALRVIRDPARAEEIAQEVLLHVWRTAPSFDADRGSARAWIATIAHRRAVDTVRSEQSSRDRAQRAAAREPRPQHDSVSEEVVERMERSRVKNALALLTPLQRQVIELAYYEGNTYREVAADLSTPLGTIKTRMRDAMRRLAEILEGTDV